MIMNKNNISVKIILLVHFIFIVQCIKSQNIVSNHDFEQYSTLPTTNGEITKAIGWNEVIVSCDYMNTGFNGWTPQIGGAYSGNGYAGFATYGDLIGSAEAIGQNITSNPIMPNTIYSIGLFAKKTSGVSSLGSYNQNCGGITLYGYTVQPPLNNNFIHTSSLAGAMLLWTSNVVSDSLWHYYNGFFQSNMVINYIVFTMEQTPGCKQYVYVDSISASVFSNILNLGNDTTICQGATLTLNATTSNASYLWQDNSSNPSFTVTQPGTYWVKVTVNSNITTDTINVNYNPLPSINLGNDTTICQGATLTLNATTSNATYLWQDNSSNPSFTVTHPGTFWVKITVNSCSTSDTINVNYNPLPSINLGNDTTICQGARLTLNATTSNAIYLWQDNSSNPSFTVTQLGTYWVKITVNYCSKTDSINIESKDCDIILEIPNVFTPNSDGINEYFHPKEVNGIKQATLIIYNRWGRKLFETNNIFTGWDGKYNGKVCSDGTYFWIIEFTSISNQSKTLNGSLTLIK